jgi:hypothetical protein
MEVDFQRVIVRHERACWTRTTWNNQSAIALSMMVSMEGWAG